MKRYARINNAVVAEVIEIQSNLNPADMFHPSLVFVPCNPNVQLGWGYSNKTFIQPAPVPGPSLEDLKSSKQRELGFNCNRFIETLPSGTPRYDINLKLNMFAFDPNLGKEPVRSAFGWIRAVQKAYYGQKALLQAAPDPEALGAIDISYEWFESQYGVEGSTLKDPDISTLDLMVED